MRSSKSILAGVAAGALGAALVPFVGVGAANAAVTSLTASTAVTAASAYTTPGSGTAVTNLMDLITVTGDDTFATGTSQYVVSIRLDSAPADDTGTGFAAIQLSANTAAATTGTGYALTAAGAATTAPTVTAPANYVWSRGTVVTLQNNSTTTRTLGLQGTAPNAGTYGFTAWVNSGATNFNSLEPGEPFTTGTITVGGTVASLAMTPASQSVGASQTATYVVTAKDSAGRSTFPTGSASGSTGSWANIATSPSGSTVAADASGTTTGTLSASAFIASPIEQGTAAFTMSNATAGTYGIVVGPGGTLPGTVTTASGSLVVSSVVNLASAISSGPAANSSNATTYTPQASITASGSATGNVFVPTTESKVRFTLTAASGSTPGSLLAYSVADSSGATKAGVTAGSFTTAIDAAGKATVEVTATTITTGTTYTVVLGQGSAKVTYTVTYGVPALSITNLSTVPGLGTSSFAQTNTAVPIAATVTDQYGQKLANITVSSVPSVSAATSGVTDASGTATVTIPAAGSTTSQTVDFKVTAPLGSASSATGNPLTIIYNASGAPSSLTATSTAGSVTATAAATQNVDVSGAVAATWTGNGNNGWMAVTATVGGSVTGVPVTFSATDAYFAPANTNLLSSSTTKAGSIVANTSGGGAATVFVKATKTGVATVKLTAGTTSTNIAWKVANVAADARSIAVTPATQDASGRAQVTATVTDVFGNPVANAALNFSEVGVGNFASGASTLSTATGPTGIVTVDVLSSESGDSAVTVLAGATADYAGAANSPVAGSPAGKSAGVAAIKFGAGGKTITISGTRTTVGGKPGIEISGVTTGIENGKTVIPFFRFPGQTTFTQGSARPVVTDGAFTWQRKTGKKFYAYVTNDDGAVTSNRVVIAAN